MTNDEAHQGCRVCSRTDVTLKVDRTLRMHVHPGCRGSSFLSPDSGRCSGAGHPPKGELGRYAIAVLHLLAEEFADLREPVTAEVIGEAIQQYRTTPYDHFECLLTSTGKWRLRGNREIAGRVRVACWKAADEMSEADRERERSLNALLDKIRN